MMPRNAKSRLKRKVTAQNSESQPAGAFRSARTRKSSKAPTPNPKTEVAKLPRVAKRSGKLLPVGSRYFVR